MTVEILTVRYSVRYDPALSLKDQFYDEIQTAVAYHEGETTQDQKKLNGLLMGGYEIKSTVPIEKEYFQKPGFTHTALLLVYTLFKPDLIHVNADNDTIRIGGADEPDQASDNLAGLAARTRAMGDDFESERFFERPVLITGVPSGNGYTWFEPNGKVQRGSLADFVQAIIRHHETWGLS